MSDEQEVENALEEAVLETGLMGVEGVEEGLVDLAMAENLGDAGQAMAAMAASNITRGVDASVFAARAAALSEAVGEAGATDLAEGAAMLAASDDLNVQSALVGALSEEDMANGMTLAGIAGQLTAVADVVALLEMPVLAAFLDDKSDELYEMAVDVLLRAGATRTLAAAMEATGKDVGALGENEMAEGLARLAVSGSMSARSQELADAGVELTAAGLAEAAAAEGMREASKDMTAQAVGEVAAGAAALGASDTLDVLAEELEDE